MEDLTQLFKPLVGHLVRCVYRDKDQVFAIKGKLVQVLGNFIVVRTYKHSYIINFSEVLKLQDAEGGDRSE